MIKTFFKLTLILCLISHPLFAKDPLPSWNNSSVKKKIINYVNIITNPNSPNFVPQDHRVAAFDLDGTLITEWPINFQRALAVSRLKELAQSSPPLKQLQPYKAALTNDHHFYNHKKNHSHVFLTAFNNHSQKQYHNYISNFLNTQKDPHWKVTYDKLFYKPALELINFLEDNGFIIYICSTTEVECIRVLLSHALNMEPVQIIGNEVVKNVSIKQGKVNFLFTDQFRQPENRSEQKCVYCNYRVGEPPIVGFGNSSGDAALLKMVHSSKFPSLVLVLDHDDPIRELKYHDHNLLKDAKKNKWNIISMKNHFKYVHTTPLAPNQRGLDISMYLK